MILRFFPAGVPNSDAIAWVTYYEKLACEVLLAVGLGPAGYPLEDLRPLI